MPGMAPSIEDVIALAQRMAQNPSDSVSLSGQLVEQIQALPPFAGELLSRPHFERATLWTLGCSFENVPATGAVPPQVIRMPHDVWIRSVQVQVFPVLVPFDANFATLSLAVSTLRALRFSTGNNGRGLARVNWRLDARQGFVSNGQAEILAPAAIISGDGCFPADKDWQLQKEQTIEVRLENLFPDLQLGASAAEMILRWAVVTFWAEEIDQPSIQ
jgi:hypothetical protein